MGATANDDGADNTRQDQPRSESRP